MVVDDAEGMSRWERQRRSLAMERRGETGAAMKSKTRLAVAIGIAAFLGYGLLLRALAGRRHQAKSGLGPDHPREGDRCTFHQGTNAEDKPIKEERSCA